VVVTEELTWQDRHQVLLVVDVHDVSGKLGVDQVRPHLIAGARQAIPDKLDSHSGG